MTKEEAAIYDLAEDILPYLDFDLPEHVVRSHARHAVRALVNGLNRSQTIAMSGAIIGEQSFLYRNPEAQ